MSDQTGGPGTTAPPRRPTLQELADQARATIEEQARQANDLQGQRSAINAISGRVAQHDDAIADLRDASAQQADAVDRLGQRTLVVEGRTDSLEDLARANAAGVAGLTANMADLTTNVNTLATTVGQHDTRLDAVEDAVTPAAMRTVVTEVVEERMRAVRFNWVAFAVVAIVGFIIDLLVFSEMGSFNSAEAPKLSKHLTDVMHTQNFLAVMLVVLALAILIALIVPVVGQDERPRQDRQPRPPRQPGSGGGFMAGLRNVWRRGRGTPAATAPIPANSTPVATTNPSASSNAPTQVLPAVPTSGPTPSSGNP